MGGEHVGDLAEAGDVLSPTIISLFGLLSSPVEQETCHFCFETITKGQFMVLKLPCCGHLTHACCFKTWASTSQKDSIVHCAYCRTAYPYEDTCFLCLQEHAENLNCAKCCHTKVHPYEDTCFLCLQEYTENLNCTKCCHTKVHAECTEDLTVLLSLLTHDHTLQCGQLTECNRLWVGV